MSVLIRGGEEVVINMDFFKEYFIGVLLWIFEYYGLRVVVSLNGLWRKRMEKFKGLKCLWVKRIGNGWFKSWEVVGWGYMEV